MSAPRVDCPICGRSVALTVKGRLRVHRVSWWRSHKSGGICSASQHVPAQLPPRSSRA